MRSPIINVMDRAARRVGRGLARDFGEVQQLQASRKGTGDFVAAALRRARQKLRDDLAKARPDFGISDGREEASNQPDGKHRWLLNPLDGLTNYLHGQPHFAIAIAHQDGATLVESIVYDPLREELFWAVRNTGAYLNDVRLRVSARQHLKDCVVAVGAPGADGGDPAAYFATLAAISAATAEIRSFGTPALDLAYVAAGRLDGAWYGGLPAAEIAAGTLLVREAGGFITDRDGRDRALHGAEAVAANGQVHELLLARLRNADSAAKR